MIERTRFLPAVALCLLMASGGSAHAELCSNIGHLHNRTDKTFEITTLGHGPAAFPVTAIIPCDEYGDVVMEVWNPASPAAKTLTLAPGASIRFECTPTMAREVHKMKFQIQESGSPDWGLCYYWAFRWETAETSATLRHAGVSALAMPADLPFEVRTLPGQFDAMIVPAAARAKEESKAVAAPATPGTVPEPWAWDTLPAHLISELAQGGIHGPAAGAGATPGTGSSSSSSSPEAGSHAPGAGAGAGGGTGAAASGAGLGGDPGSPVPPSC